MTERRHTKFGFRNLLSHYRFGAVYRQENSAHQYVAKCLEVRRVRSLMNYTYTLKRTTKRILLAGLLLAAVLTFSSSASAAYYPKTDRLENHNRLQQTNLQQSHPTAASGGEKHDPNSR